MYDELKKILDEISYNRKSYKDDMKSNGNWNDFIVNMDFVNLYPNVMRKLNITSILRKEKIKRIFQ